MREDGSRIALTVEHSYPTSSGEFTAKVPSGVYTCKRGQHQLHEMANPFTTFEVTNVPGHTNILIHVGNYNSDSDGCILVGSDVAPRPGLPDESMLINSRLAFEAFMALQDGLDTFQLTVIP